MEAKPPTRADNKSGVRGVCWHKHANKWRAQIRDVERGGETRTLGYFDTAEQAGVAYEKAWRVQQCMLMTHPKAKPMPKPSPKPVPAPSPQPEEDIFS